MGSRDNSQANYWIFSVLVLSAAVFASGFQLESRPDDVWIRMLERPERMARLRTDEIVAHLGLKPGDIVTDIGAGIGTFSRPMARAVAPGGKVLAVEVVPALVDEIERRAQREKIENVEAILGHFDDPSLPTRDVDLAFIHSVLNHIEHREAYLETLVSYLNPEGRVAIIENNPQTHPPHGDGPHRPRTTVEQVKEWMAAVGFGVDEEWDLLDDRFFVVFSKNQ